MPISKQRLEYLYKTNPVKDILKKLKISKSKLYKLLQNYDIELKSSNGNALHRWMARVGVPESIEEYQKKWKHQKGRPLDKWFGDDAVEDYYCDVKSPIERQEESDFVSVLPVREGNAVRFYKGI